VLERREIVQEYYAAVTWDGRKKLPVVIFRSTWRCSSAPMTNVARRTGIGPMRRRHLRSVLRIEQQVYPRPWTFGLFLSEIGQRTTRLYYERQRFGDAVGDLRVGDEGGAGLGEAEEVAEKIRAKARTIAAHELEVAEEDLEWKDGKFQVTGAPDKAKTIPEVAFSAWTAHALPAEVEPGLFATAVYDPPNFTFPSGAHICVVEVDPDTGQVFIVKYVAVDDCGTIINPMIVDGQVMGGVAQGIAEAVYEEAL